MSRFAASRRLVGGAMAFALCAVFLAVPSRSDEDEAALTRRIDRLVLQLGAESFKEREQASRELGELGAKAKSALERAVAQTTDEEVKQRAERLLADLGGSTKELPKVVDPVPLDESDVLRRSIELLRESFARGLPGMRMELGGEQRVVAIEDGVRYEFSRDKAGAFEVVVTQDEKVTRHAFKDEAEFKAAQPALHERWRNMGLGFGGLGAGPAAEAMRRMAEEQRRIMEALLKGEGLEQSIEKLIEAQRRKIEERMRGLDLEQMRDRLLEELRRPFPDRERLDRALEQLGRARSPEELRRALDLATSELRRARGELPPLADPEPVPAPLPVPMRQGLRLSPPSEVLREQLGLEGGAVVLALDPASPFAGSTLAVHDIVIEAAGAVVTGPDGLVSALEALGPGQAIAVVVLRRGQRVSLELKR